MEAIVSSSIQDAGLLFDGLSRAEDPCPMQAGVGPSTGLLGSFRDTVAGLPELEVLK